MSLDGKRNEMADDDFSFLETDEFAGFLMARQVVYVGQEAGSFGHRISKEGLPFSQGIDGQPLPEGRVCRRQVAVTHFIVIDAGDDR